VKFQDPDVQKAFEKMFEEAKGSKMLNRGLSDEHLQVLVLMSMYFWFRTMGDGESTKTQEIVEHLVTVDLRPALRGYYRRYSWCETASFTGLCDRLGHLAEEDLCDRDA
jgi:hypothetical protein